MIRRSHILTLMLLPLLAALAVAACGEPPIIEPDQQGPDYKQNVIQANRYLSEREETNIKSYIERRGWTVRELPCGARLFEIEKGSGSLLQNDDSVRVTYSVEALDGTVIYSGRTETFMVGRLHPNEGVDAALQVLRHGSRASIVLPSSTAFGVVGDHDRIPPRTPVVYNISVE